MIILFGILVYIYFGIGFIESVIENRREVVSSDARILDFILFEYYSLAILFLPGYLIYRLFAGDFRVGSIFKLTKRKIVIDFLLSMILVLSVTGILIEFRNQIPFIWKFATVSWLFFYFLIGSVGYTAFVNMEKNSNLIRKIGIDGRIIYFIPWKIVSSLKAIGKLKSVEAK